MTSMIYAILTAALLATASGQYQRDKDKQMKDQLLGRNYDGTILPSGDNGTGPVSVNVSLFVKNILSVNDKQGKLQLELGIRLRWNDPRMIYSSFPPSSGPESINLPAASVDKMWVPDLYIVNGLKEEKEHSHRFARISVQNGNVQYNYQTKVTTRCEMSLRYYPHDTQHCAIKLSSYGFSDEDIRFQWESDSDVTISEGFAGSGLGFLLNGYNTGLCDASTSTGNYSCVMLTLNLKRESGYFCIHVYIPCVMLIIISWLSYWLHPIKSATPRLLVCIAALGLALMGINVFNQSAPHVSYTKAIDTWTGITLTFIFAALVEFVVVNFFGHCGACSMALKGKRHVPDGSDNVENAEQQIPLNPTENEGKNCTTNEVNDNVIGHKHASCIDVIFRIMIPILFFVFVIIYWIIFV